MRSGAGLTTPSRRAILTLLSGWLTKSARASSELQGEGGADALRSNAVRGSSARHRWVMLSSTDGIITGGLALLRRPTERRASVRHLTDDSQTAANQSVCGHET